MASKLKNSWMRKNAQKIFWCLLGLSGSLAGCHANSLVVTKGMAPVFTLPETKLQYEYGEHGNNCLQLDTVLMPPARIKILDTSNSPIYKISYEISEKSKGSGYVHQHFLKNCCEQVKDPKSPCVMRLEDIRAVFERCIQEKVPYCFGGNSFDSIQLPKEYQFTPSGEYIPGKQFDFRGFDCSGLLFYISNGILPHCTRGLDTCGKKIYTFDWQKDYSDEEKQKVLASLRDTDYLVFVRNKKTQMIGSGHVMVSYKGGFIEFRGIAKGCCYTTKENALQRLNEMITSSKEFCSDLFVIRWHPEVK